MEEYKKKYEHAMLRMNKWVEGSEIIDPKEVAEFVFPELKESEDEKIRRDIIRYLKKTSPAIGENIEKMLAWLEKQGEQKPTDKVEPKFKVGDTIVEKDLDEYDYETIKDIKDGQYIFTDGYCMNIDEQEGWQLVKTTVNKEQKSAWNEDDESMLQNILECLKNGWSKLPTDILKYESWLESLKERYSWKPSEEQMTALNYVINLMASSESPTENDYYYNVFKDMRTHLKKLTEE